MNLTQYNRDRLTLGNVLFIVLINFLFSLLFHHLMLLSLPLEEWADNLALTIVLIMGGVIVLMILVVGSTRDHRTLPMLLQSFLMLSLAFLTAFYLFYPNKWISSIFINRLLTPVAWYFMLTVLLGYTTYFRLNLARADQIDLRVYAFIISPFILVPLLGLAFYGLMLVLEIDQFDLVTHSCEMIALQTVVITLYTFITLKLYRILSFNRNLFVFFTLTGLFIYIGAYLYAIL